MFGKGFPRCDVEHVKRRRRWSGELDIVLADTRRDTFPPDGIERIADKALQGQGYIAGSSARALSLCGNPFLATIDALHDALKGVCAKDSLIRRLEKFTANFLSHMSGMTAVIAHREMCRRDNQKRLVQIAARVAQQRRIVEMVMDVHFKSSKSPRSFA